MIPISSSVIFGFYDSLFFMIVCKIKTFLCFQWRQLSKGINGDLEWKAGKNPVLAFFFFLSYLEEKQKNKLVASKITTSSWNLSSTY